MKENFFFKGPQKLMVFPFKEEIQVLKKKCPGGGGGGVEEEE